MNRYMTMKTNKIKLIQFLIAIFYKFSLDLVYSNAILDYYQSNFRYINHATENYILSWVIFILLAFLFIFFLKDDLLSYSAKVLFIFSCIPSIAIFGINNIKLSAYMLMIIYWINMFIAIKVMQKINLGKVKIISKSINISTKNYILFFISLVVVLIMSGLYGDFRIFIDFEDTHYYRFALREANLPVIVAYGLPIMATVVIPYLMGYFLSRRKYLISFIFIFLGSMLYSIGGNKSWIFLYLVIIFIFIFFKKKHKFINLETRLLLGLIVFGLISNYLYYQNNDIELMTMYDRILILPSEISYFYYDFFNKNEALLLRESILRHFFPSPYNINTPFLIGGLYLSGFGEHANNGLFGDAYSNFKIVGVFIYPYLISFVYKIIDSYSEGVDKRISASMIILLSWSCINGPFFAWLLTGGVIIYILLLNLNRKIKHNYKGRL